MKTAGTILSTFFHNDFVKKAHRYSELFDSWEDITAKNGIAAAATHSRVKELQKGILLIEMDHPGWKQLIQTKQTKILNDFRNRFPEMKISSMSLVLGKSDQSDKTVEISDMPNSSPDTLLESITETPVLIDETIISNIEKIKDEELKQNLLKLGQAIAERDKAL